ncbi:hypothetical protein PENTCL1PPCAC_12439, partial [Pristionchus entomophagus]
NSFQCMKCLLHGDSQTHVPIDCPMKACYCRKCELIDRRRNVTNKLVKLGREQKLQLGISDRDARYTCARCRNHGVVAIKKHHTPCPFSLCQCEPCVLNAERRRIDSELTAINREQRASSEESTESSPSQSDSESDQYFPLSPVESPLSSETKVIMDLINSLASASFDPENFDYAALSDFFSQPTILIPDEWWPVMGEISNLVLTSLERFPRFNGIDFRTGLLHHQY